MSSSIRTVRTVRARGTLCAALSVTLLTVAGCSGDGDGDGGDESRPATSAPASRSASPSVTASPSSGTALPDSLTRQKLDWKDCPAPSTAQGGGDAPGGAWECGTLKVPLDYAQPDKDTIGLALIRSPAKDDAQRIGSLVFNFGGPGGSGVATLPGFATDYDSLRSRYDLVSFDPRGVGDSAGVKCLSDKELDASATVDSVPDNKAELKSVLAENKRYAAACQQNSGKVLPHVDTASAARDMDLMRQVLGDEKLYYFGISYGTQLGGVYAHLFPKNVGRAVLDAVVDPTADAAASSLGQAEGFQLALDDYLADCAKKKSCPVGDDPKKAVKEISSILDDLDGEPAPTNGGRELTRDQALNGIAAALYDEETWKYLTLGLTQLQQTHQGDVLLSLADSMAGRDPSGHYSNIQAANSAISCLDDSSRYTAKDIQARLPEFRKASPIFGDFLAWGLLGCDSWPEPGKDRHPEVSADGAAPIVVIGNTGDPATPYAGARKMADALGDGVGIHLTYRGEGHGSYNSGNTCMTKAVDSYLLDGKIPKDGATCR